ncbi:hypothetical protein FACS189449_08480 [Alphaproteobacteria bacterium]|nr:hypothetical protein FACS189449_08480 [Alphaproteobacteria bacterium]
MERETMTVDELWEAIGKAYGASDEQVADLVRRMTTDTNKKEIKEENKNGL